VVEILNCMRTIKLPSMFQLDEVVSYCGEGIRSSGIIISVTFHLDKIRYSIEIVDGNKKKTVHNVSQSEIEGDTWRED